MSQDEKNGWPSFDAILRDVLPAEVEERLRPETSEAARARREAALSPGTEFTAPVAEPPRRSATRSKVSQPALSNTDYSGAAPPIDGGMEDLVLPAPLPPLEFDTSKIKELLEPSLNDTDTLDLSALQELEETEIEILEPIPELEDVVDTVEEDTEIEDSVIEDTATEIEEDIEIEDTATEIEEDIEIEDTATEVEEEDAETEDVESEDFFSESAQSGIYFETDTEPVVDTDETAEGAFGAPLVFDLGSEELVELEANEPVVESAELEDPFADLTASDPFGTADVPTVEFDSAGLEEPSVQESFGEFQIPQDDLFDLSESSDDIEELSRVRSEELFEVEDFVEDNRGETDLFEVTDPNSGPLDETNSDHEDLFGPAESSDGPQNLFSIANEPDTEEEAEVSDLFGTDSWSTDFNSVATAQAIEGDLEDLDSLDENLAEVVPFDTNRPGVELELDTAGQGDPLAPIEADSRKVQYAELIDEEVETPAWRQIEDPSKTNTEDPWAHMRPVEEPKKKRWWGGIFGNGSKKSKSDEMVAQQEEIDAAVNLSIDTVCPECGSDGHVDLDDPIGRRVHLSCTACRTEWHTPYNFDIHS